MVDAGEDTPEGQGQLARDGRLAPDVRLRVDRLLVSAAALVWIAGTMVGFGVFGTGVEEQGEGIFSDHATLIAPHGPAFSIWSVIYVGLAGYVVWQWLPASRSAAWARVTRRPAAVAIALNGLWLAVVYAGWVWLSVVVMAGIVVALKFVLHFTTRLQPEGWASKVWVAATYGLYLGWICVAICANIASVLVGSGVAPATTTSAGVTVGVLAVVIAIAATLLRWSGQWWFRAGLAAAIAWGTGWVSAGRFIGELRSDLVGVAAGVTAVAVVGLGVWSLRSAQREPAGVSSRGPARL